MYKKLICLIIIAGILFLSLGCDPEPTGLSEELKEYAFVGIVICAFLTVDPAVTAVTVGDVTTYTFTNIPYNEPTDPDAVVNGTIVETDDDVTVTNDLDLTFSNDDMGLETIGGSFGGSSGEDITTGEIIINGYSVPATEFQAYLNELSG